MKVNLSRAELVKSLAKVQGIVERRNTLPILSYVLMSAEGSSMEMISTDLEVGLKAIYDDVEVVEPGTVTIMAKKAFEIAREMPEEEVEIKSEDSSWVRLTSGRANFRMVGLPKDDFPEFPKYSSQAGMVISRKILIDMIHKTSFAISHDQTRYALNGVLMEVTTEETEGGQLCRMVSTDGHRLAMVEKACARGNTEERSLIVPRKAVMELKKLLEDESEEEIRMDFQENHVFFIGKKIVMAARLIEGQFPEYQQVIPKESDKMVVIDREEFNQVLRRVSILTADRSNPVSFKFEPEKMTISTNNPDVGEASESMSVEYEGEPIELGFNARYVLDVLGAVEEKKVVLQMNEPLSPGLLTQEEDQSYSYVIMPMRL